tara:strand:- start:4456 stop:4911 length:456 start_codon:yes stop_codon:yes gene_type:complete
MTLNYAKHEEEFHGVFKLVSGEEILAKAVLTVEDYGGTDAKESLAFLQDPVCIQIVDKPISENKMMRGMGFHKWMNMSDEEFFIIREKDILSVASMSKEIIFMYEAFIKSLEPEDKVRERTTKRRSSAEDATGYLGRIDNARKLFEKLYNT